MPCDNCPVGARCPGLDHPRACELQRDDPALRDHLIRLAGLDPTKPHDPQQRTIRVDRPHKTTSAPHGVFASGVTSKIRVGFLAPCMNAGGAENVQLAMIRGLDPDRFQLVGLVVLESMERTDATMTALTNAHLPIRYGFESIADLAHASDVIVSWCVEKLDAYLGGASCRIIYLDHFPHSQALPLVAQDCLRNVAAVVGVSALCAPAWTDPEWDGRYATIPNGIDLDRLKPTRTRAQMRQQWGIPADAVVAGSYCRIALNRRPDAVLRALPELPPNFYAVIVGGATDGDELTYLHQLRGQLTPEQQSRLRILPADPHAGDVLGAFDVLVSAPSGTTESFGLTAAEGLLMGLPVVATRFGLAQLHPAFFTHVALDDGSMNLAAAISSAVANGPHPDARAFIARTYSPEAFIAAWSDLITSLARPKPATVPPGLLRQALSFARSVVRHVGSGAVELDGDQVASRAAICGQCDHHDADADRCLLCGCNLAIKRRWPREKCPDGRWPEVITTTTGEPNDATL